jgi:hypothetical protein
LDTDNIFIINSSLCAIPPFAYLRKTLEPPAIKMSAYTTPNKHIAIPRGVQPQSETAPIEAAFAECVGLPAVAVGEVKLLPALAVDPADDPLAARFVQFPPSSKPS